MLHAVGPVGRAVPIPISLVKVDISCDKSLDEVGMALSRRDMEAREALSVDDLRITTAIEEFLDCFFHVQLRGQVHGRIASDVFILWLVHLGVSLQQDVDNCGVLGFHSVLNKESSG